MSDVKWTTTNYNKAPHWESYFYLVAAILAVLGDIIVLLTLHLVDEVNGKKHACSQQIISLSYASLSCNMIIILWQIFFRIVKSKDTKLLVCFITQPLSVITQSWTMLWSGAIAINIGLALYWRDEAKIQKCQRNLQWWMWAVGTIPGIILYINQIVKLCDYNVKPREIFILWENTCQYRQTMGYSIEVSCLGICYISTLVLNIRGINIARRALQNTPRAVHNKHLRRMMLYMLVFVILWACRFFDDIIGFFIKNEHNVSILWFFPGFQGFFNAVLLGIGPLKSMIQALSKIKIFGESDENADGNIYRDSLLRGIRFDWRPTDVVVPRRFPGEDETLQALASEEREFRANEMDRWIHLQQQRAAGLETAASPLSSSSSSPLDSECTLRCCSVNNIETKQEDKTDN